MRLRVITFLLLPLLLLGCASTNTVTNKTLNSTPLANGQAETPQTRKFHRILGTENRGWYYYGDDIAIIEDVNVDGLQVRLIKHKNSQCQSGFSYFMELNGPISNDSTFVIEQLITRIPEPCIDKTTNNRVVPTVYMNSAGGRLFEGYQLGLIFRKHSIKTVVGYSQECASSCAIAFLGGQYREVQEGGRLMFHTPYLERQSGLDCIDPEGELSQLLLNYYRAMMKKDDADRLFVRTFKYCSSEQGWQVNHSAADIFGVATNEFIASDSQYLLSTSNEIALIDKQYGLLWYQTILDNGYFQNLSKQDKVSFWLGYLTIKHQLVGLSNSPVPEIDYGFQLVVELYMQQKDFETAELLLDNILLSYDQAETHYLKGLMLLSQENPAYSEEKGMQLLTKAAKGGSHNAGAYLGYQYIGEQNYLKAYSYLKPASDAGNLTATANLAFMYENGFHVAKDRKQAIKLYRQAAQEVSWAKEQLIRLNIAIK
ncbi:SEL1-like repeat protein [Paraferrimonas sp. SM1919]|uniref:SEL1-like repeat protein n=1 Tax=Paraferrimonas sp. SM1919 TaxID=2662263 RepID=UPI0013D51910|nr:SEL1-like repeat protein [Paraferrimonas sp. SM1919]